MEGNTRVKTHKEEHGGGKMEADIKGDTTGGDHLSSSTINRSRGNRSFPFKADTHRARKTNSSPEDYKVGKEGE